MNPDRGPLRRQLDVNAHDSLQAAVRTGEDVDETLLEAASSSDFANYLADKVTKRLMWEDGCREWSPSSGEAEEATQPAAAPSS